MTLKELSADNVLRHFNLLLFRLLGQLDVDNMINQGSISDLSVFLA